MPGPHLPSTYRLLALVGVATAVKVGGPGAIFWMWMAAFFGMATKYSEGLLAIKYRSVDEKGEIAGGPMFYIRNGMGEKWKPLATFFALACIGVAYFGIGTFPQVNAIVDSVELSFGFPKAATDAILTFFIAAIVTLDLTNAIPTALVGLPGGVLSTPMMEHALYLKSQGRAAETIKKMAAGSAIGTIVAIPVSLLIATAITPYAETLRPKL